MTRTESVPHSTALSWYSTLDSTTHLPIYDQYICTRYGCLSCLSLVQTLLVISVLRSAHLAAVVLEHERRLDQREARTAGGVASQIFENLSKICLCE